MRATTLRVALILLACQLIPIAPGKELSFAARAGMVQVQAEGTVPASPAGLQSQLEVILKSAKDHDSKHVDDLISALQLSDTTNWFETTFGEEKGKSLAATYKNSWVDYQSSVNDIFRNSGTAKHIHVFVKEFSAASPSPSETFVQEILQSAKTPLTVYTAYAGKDRGTDALPGLYVYAQGSFRILNWRPFYGLPSVKTMRIRFSEELSQRSLVHQVNPVPPADPALRKMRGKVVLHVILDRDGNVFKLEPVAGPPELIEAAVAAVRQWRYRPTLLNGDPVEMDTTIVIVFGG